MTNFIRQAFVIVSVILLFLSGYYIGASDTLLAGQHLKIGSMVPLSLMLITAAFHSKDYDKEVTLGMMLFCTIFFAMRFAGNYQISGDISYSTFVWWIFATISIAAITAAISSKDW